MLELLLSIWLIAGYISARSSFPQPLSPERERDWPRAIPMPAAN